MRCRACELLLDETDNYCRRCGSPVQLAALEPVDAGSEMTVGSPAAALLAGAAKPMATGAAFMVAGALARYALRRMTRATVAPRLLDSAARRPGLPERPVKGETVEIVWYRRTVRS